MARQSVSGAAKCAASRREPAAVTQRSRQPSSVCEVVLTLALELELAPAPQEDAGLDLDVDKADDGVVVDSALSDTAVGGDKEDADDDAAVAGSSAAPTRCSGAWR